MDRAVAGVLLLAGVVHLLPLTAIRSVSAVSSTYGVPEPAGGSAVLLRHRAALLALVGGVLLAGAIDEDVRALALGVGVASTSSYVVLARSAREPELRRVLVIDVVLLVLLLLAALAQVL